MISTFVAIMLALRRKLVHVVQTPASNIPEYQWPVRQAVVS